MRLRFLIEDVVNRSASRESRVGDERAMTSPWHRLRAHDSDRLEARQSKKVIQSFAELARFHVVGVGPKARVSPLGVVRIPTSPPPAAKRWEVRISPAAVDDCPFQGRAGKVRIPDGCGKGANINQMRRALSREQPEELLERSGGMPDCVDLSGGHAPRSCRPRRAVFPTAV